MTRSPRRLTWPRRASAALVAVALAVAGGLGTLDVAQAGPAESPSSARTQASPDLTSVGAAAAALVGSLSAPLPTPTPPPPDAYAPTPEVRLGQLEIPSIGVSQPFFEGVTLTALNRGPSHWPDTAMPGDLGNVVIAGHRTTHSRPFFDLDLVQPGDEMILTMTSGERYVYVLDQVDIVDDQAMAIIDQTYDYRATIFGCHPKGSARQRIVGHFHLQSPPAT